MRHPRWLCLLAACSADAKPASPRPGPVAQAAPGFWEVWGDGQAELDHYSLVTPRYGELREGTAILVFVTEDFTDAQRVKSDGGHGDEFPVWKLNDIRHFQTGVYDYEVMTSSFVRLDGRAPLGHPVKVSHSVQEWCGHAYTQVVPRDAGLEWTQHSYFDGEGDQQRTLELPVDGVLADVLPQLVRGWVGALVEPGGTRTVPGLPTLLHDRFAHVRPAWGPMGLSASASTMTVTVPAGTFEVREVTAEQGGVSTTWRVEVASPHHLVSWTRSDGERAELVKTARLPYWQLHGEADERALAELGLEPTSR